MSGDAAVLHPTHYGGDVPHEVIKCLAAWGLESNAILWNVVKYVSRAGKKDPAKRLQDLRKAAFYLEYEIQKESKKYAEIHEAPECNLEESENQRCPSADWHDVQRRIKEAARAK